MKMLFKALIVLALISPVLSVADFEPEIQYLSWCQGNKIVAENESREIVVKADCGEDTCKEFLRPMGAGYVSYAVCR